MSLVNLKEILKDAKENKYGVGMFNTVNLEMVRAIIGAAEEEKAPVIISLAEVHIPYGSLETLAPIMVKAAVESKVPVAVHFDHGMTFDLMIKAAHLGFTSIMFDGSLLPYEENVKMTREIVRLSSILGASVEAELGHVGGAEGGGEDGEEALYTNVDQAADFVDLTGVDALAVAIGSAHGEYKKQPKLDLERLEAISRRVDVPLVLHGGSGLSDEDFRASISKGICKVNIFTDMSLAAVNRIRKEVDRKISYPDLINATVEAIKEEVAKKIRLFGGSNRA